MRTYSVAVAVTMSVALAVGGASGTSAQEGSQSPIAADVIDEALRRSIPIEDVPAVANVVALDENGILTGTYDGHSIAELQDLTALARQYGWDGTTAILSRKREEEFTAIYREAYYADNFSGGMIKSTPAQSWIGFAGSAPAAIAQKTRAAGITLREDLPFSRRILLDQQSAALKVAQAVDPEVSSSIDEDRLEVEIYSEKRRYDVKARIESSTSASGLKLSGPRITVDGDSGPAGGDEDAYARGGGRLNLSVLCTAGFVLRRNSDGLKRLGTAEHCGGEGTTGRYYNHAVDGGDDGVTVKTVIDRSNGDLSIVGVWSFAKIPSFYWNQNEKRYVQSVASDASHYPPGKKLCVYGRTTGPIAGWDYCAEVETRTATRSGGYEKLTRMNAHVTQGGDSGGPWYWSTTAYGIHSGWVTHDDKQKSVWTPVHHYNWYGWSVWTQ